MNKHPEFTALLRERWFWISLGCIGYLVSLYGIFVGLDFSLTILTLPIAVLPMAFSKFGMAERLKATTFAAIFVYLFLLVVLVRNTYFPSTTAMVLELFFILLVTIPAFLLRAPMYLLIGPQQADAILLLSGFLFVALYVWGIVRAPRMHPRTAKMMLAIVLLSVLITYVECTDLGRGIRHITEVSGIDQGIRNYYRVAVEGY